MLPSDWPRKQGLKSRWITAIATSAVVFSVFVSWSCSKVFRKSKVKIPKLSSLRQAIIGNGQIEITSVFGPPRAASIGNAVTWYYPLHSRDQIGMAISFTEGLASDVEFFQTPTERSHLFRVFDAE